MASPPGPSEVTSPRSAILQTAVGGLPLLLAQDEARSGGCQLPGCSPAGDGLPPSLLRQQPLPIMARASRVLPCLGSAACRAFTMPGKSTGIRVE